MAPLTILLAQPEDIISRHFTMKEGLSNEYVLCLLQDSQGFLWMGTQGGLNKFDGYHFTTYRENPSDSNSLSNNFIHSLWEDKQQRLWIGTRTGLDLFDLRTEKFHHLLPDSLDPAQGSDVDVRKIRERKDGKAWLCTSQGVFLADPQTLALERVIHFSHFQEEGENYFLDIAEARDGSVWTASARGLVHMDVHTGQTTRYRHDPSNPHSLSASGDDMVWMVHVDRHDRVWAGTGYGLNLFNPEDQTFTHFLPEKSQSDQLNLPIITVHTLLEYPDGKFWIGFSAGLYSFHPETGKFNLLVNKHSWSLLKDRGGNIWLGSGYGLFQIAPQSKKFNIYQQFGQTDYILSLAEDADHQTWISCGSGLFRSDPSSRNFFQYRHDPENPHSFSGNSIAGIIPDHEGGIWLAAIGKLEKFNLQNQTFSSVALPIGPATKFPAMLLDSRGKIWIGGWVEITIYDPQTETFERLAAFPGPTPQSFWEDWEENIWIGTINGLFRYNLQTGQLNVFKNDPADPQSLSNNRVYDLMMDQDSTLWIGTAGGLNKMIPGTENEEPKFVHWRTTNSNLPHDDVFSIVEGADSTLWMGCGNQISHFFPQTGKFRNYDHNDGLHGQGIGNSGKGLRSHNGEIYFGTMDGLVIFHPDSLQDNPYISPVAITGLSIHNQPVSVNGSYIDTLQWDTPLAHTILYTDEVELTYQQNDFSLEFAALNFINPENNRYRYKLEPYEEDWIETSATNRIARYTNLSPGRYTFRVIGSNNDGLWNGEGRSLSILIHPPWWQTWWAYGFYGMLAIGFLYGLRQYTVKRERLKHELKLQRLEAEKMHEIDHLKTRFFANISHEFRTPLTLILGPVKKLMDKYCAPDDQNYLKGIQRNAQRLLHLVNQLLDLSKLEAGKLKLEAIKSDIVSFLKARAHAFSSLAEHKHIHFGVQLPEEKIGAYFDRDKLEKIINNLLSNAFKFTDEGGSVRLKGQAVTQGTKDWMQIQVADSGKGIPEEETDKIFDRFYQVDSSQTREQEGTGIGLALTKELVELHHGEIRVESKEGTGTTFTLLLPLGKEHLKEAEIIQELPLPEEEIDAEEDRIHPSEILSHTSDNYLEDEVERTVEKPVVLIVEDHQEVRRFIRESISDHYQVKEAENGKIGVEIARKLLPDLIISDVMMPEMDGYALCEKIKTDELTSHIPVILLTAKADRQSKLTGLETGADDYLVKPFDAEELLLIIRNHIEERRKIRERFSREITLEPKQISITSFDEKFLTKVLAIIEDHMDDENFSIEELSREVGYSNMHLYRKIKALTGQTPSVFVRTIRLKRAAQLLIGKSDNVTQIAYSVGFSSLAYFNKCFKEQFGTAPGQFARHILPKE
jgi:signal transduction histidine kinase/ligand-binding sensor domain-containing protein/DNA-binding response OmpR family regulator